jgi:hypothetical protein
MSTHFGESERDLGVYVDLYSANTSDDVMEKAAHGHSQDFRNEIYTRFPSLIPKLCLLDLVFMLPLDGISHSRGYVTSPKPKAVNAYNAIIEQLVVRKKCDIANHPCFRVGLPYAESIPGPQTELELAEFLKALENQSSDSLRVAQRHLVGEIKRNSGSPTLIQAEDTDGWQTRTWSVPRDNAKDMYGGADKDVYKSFTTFLEMLTNKATSFLSSDGSAMAWFYAIPIAWWSRKLKKLGDRFSVEWKPLPGGSLFLGTSTQLNNEQIHFLSSYCADTIGAGYRHNQGREEGQDEGVEKAVMVFGHQIKTLAGGISGHQRKWLFPLSKLEDFQKLELDPPCEVTPVPRLIEALGRTVSFWSLSHSKTALDLPDDFIRTFADIIRQACSFAESMRLASEFARVDMSDPQSLQLLRSRPKVKLELGELEAWFLDSSQFQYVNDDEVVFDRHASNDEQWKQLAGLIRFFAIVIEGAIEYRPEAGNPSLKFKLPSANLGNGRLKIVATNPCRPVERRIDNNSGRYIGMHGGEIRTFICDRYLTSLAPDTPKPQDRIIEYTVELEINKPHWIVRGKCDE